ncbi:hypothetical protein QR680_013643 [Steinernema hermaphroditum]|uniref:RNA helicase n=1 Tax=Steinernema hermaphroditum TaxID=289476 RepID=A0AA39M2P8_9BILA|nr:hypothetical protein QR680_013643 [Steinernema hermaphroditum]
MPKVSVRKKAKKIVVADECIDLNRELEGDAAPKDTQENAAPSESAKKKPKKKTNLGEETSEAESQTTKKVQKPKKRPAKSENGKEKAVAKKKAKITEIIGEDGCVDLNLALINSAPLKEIDEDGAEEEATPEESKPKKAKKAKKPNNKKAEPEHKDEEELETKEKKPKEAPKKAQKCSKNKYKKIDDTPLDESLDLSPWLPYGLPEEVMKGLRFQKFTEPSKIQQEVLPYAVQHRMDILGAAETGSGKTLAFAIPLICRLLESTPAERRVRAIVLTPTRELAIQVHDQMQHILKYTQLRSMIIVGGLSQQKQERLITGKPDIIVATPGRFWKLVSEALEGDYLANFSGVECVVVDETDRMIEKGHFEEVEQLLDHIHREAPETRQTMLFSATLTFVHAAPKRLSQKGQAQGATVDDKIEKIVEKAHLRKNHKVIDITRKFGTAETLVESRMTCKDLLEKDANVFYLLKRYPGRTLIFMNSIDACRRFYAILMKLKVEPVPMMLHAKMHQKQRLKNLERFAATPNSILLSTDVAARGLDIKGVEHVIHYQVPKTAEIYVHRSGRTARASQSGVTVLMVDPIDSHFYERIKKNLNRDVDLKLFPIDSERLYAHLRELIHLAGQAEAMEHRIKKITGNEKWWEKMAGQADIDLDEIVLGKKDRQVAEEIAHYKDEKKEVEMELKHMLSTPLPRADIKKTRYVNPEVVKAYDSAMTTDALTSLTTAEAEESAAVKKIKRSVMHSAGMREFLRRERKKQRKLGNRRRH